MVRFGIVFLLSLSVLQAGCLHFGKNGTSADAPEQTQPAEETVIVTSLAPTVISTPTPQLASKKIEEFTPTPIPSPEPSPTLSPEDLEQIQINFEDASLREILVYLAELAGWDYLISPEVGSGSVTLRTSKPFRRADVEKVLYSILDMNNVAVVDGPTTSEGKPAFKKIIPKPDAKHSPIRTRKGNDLSGIPQEDVLVTQIITTEFVSPDEILNTIRPLISPDATIITHPGANMMIITETSSNIRRILNIIELLDKKTALLELEIFQIQFADVQDITSVLDRVIGARVSIGGTSSSSAQPRKTTQTGRVGQQPQAAPSSAGGGDVGPIMIPDARSNSLIVFALRKDLDFIREIISIMDVDIYVNRKAYIYYVENAKASEIADLLAAVYTGKEDQGRATRRTTSASGKNIPEASTAGTIGGATQVQGEVSIVADERTNALIIVTAPTNYPYIVETIKKLDTMPKQVLIEVLIADVTLDESRELGISWDLQSQGDVDVGGQTYHFDGTASQTVGGPGSGFVYQLFEASRFKAILSAKANENKLEILSSPHILVANNKEATIDVGSDIPVVTSETDGGLDANGKRLFNRTIEYRSTGILLTVTPQINSANFVNMDIAQEVSNISETALEGINSPVIEKRKATTSVMVKDNYTLVIGGLIQRSKNPSREGVPWFYRIPILKYFFGKHKYSERASELLIFLTPHVVSSPDEAKLLSDQMRDKINIDQSFYKDFIGVGNVK
jgi:general secretion pathway protein D